VTCLYCQAPTPNQRACSDCLARRWDRLTPTDWPTYARCDECGAEPGCCCRDDDETPLLRPCEGRVSSTKRCRQCEGPLSGRQTTICGKGACRNADTRARYKVPVEAPCACGRPVHDGETCGRRVCRPHRRCAGDCGVRLPVDERRGPRSPRYPCCGKPYCVTRISTKRKRAAKAKQGET
jgi:hypothetical protein